MRLRTAALAALLPMMPVILLTGSCGQQPAGERIEYYIEEREPDDANSGRQTPGNSDAQAASLIFSDPTAADADGVITLNVTIKNTATDATWSLSYSAKEDLSEPTIIVEGLSAADTTVDWNTSELPAGTYFIFAALTSDGETKNFPMKDGITVAGGGEAGGEEPQPNQGPLVTLDFPLGEAVFVAGAPQDIRWTASDANNDTLMFKVEYSADAGSTWATAAEGITATTYAWDVTGLEQGITYRVRVTADDSRGGIKTAASPRNFGVALRPMTFAAGFGAMLTTRCGACHAAGRPNQAQFRSDNYALLNIGVNAKKTNIKNRIEANTMPPGGNGLGAADKAVLTMWLWSGGQ